MFPVSYSEGWVCGGTAIRHRTSSGWVIDQNYDSSVDYASIYFVNNTTGWAVGDLGRILHTTDGKNWTIQTNPDTNSRTLYSVFFLNESVGWIVGQSLILHTTDGGTTWNVEGQTVSSGKLLTGVWFTGTDNGYAVGENTFLRFR
jgi:photosystem II stability/assembly factor-like uncharacterized protein